MTTRVPSLTEQKLLLLYALDALGPATGLQLLRFMVENDLMDYIALQLSTAELDEQGLLRKLHHELGTLYAPSADGRQALSVFLKDIPHSRKSAVDAAAPAWRRRFREEKQVLCDWEESTSGEFHVHLKLLEAEMPLVDCTLSVPTRDLAQRFCARWPEKASELYAHIMRTLGEEEQ